MWKAGGAWSCALLWIALVLGMEGWLRIGARTSPALAECLGSVSFRAGFMVLLQVLPLVVVLWFSCSHSIRDFLCQTGMQSRPTRFGWYSAWVAIGLGFIGVYGVANGWVPPDRIYREFSSRGGWTQLFFFVYGIAIVPLCEEILMRGFLYRAFRGSHGKLLSTVLILCLVTTSHWGRVLHSAFAFLCIGSAAIILCLIREQTESLWDCILFHATFNAAAMFKWQICMIGLILLLPIVISSRRESPGAVHHS